MHSNDSHLYDNTRDDAPNSLSLLMLKAAFRVIEDGANADWERAIAETVEAHRKDQEKSNAPS